MKWLYLILIEGHAMNKIMITKTHCFTNAKEVFSLEQEGLTEHRQVKEIISIPHKIHTSTY